MPDLEAMSRVLYDHQWEQPEEWGRSLARLAELSDEDIALVCRLGCQGRPAEGH